MLGRLVSIVVAAFGLTLMGTAAVGQTTTTGATRGAPGSLPTSTTTTVLANGSSVSITVNQRGKSSSVWGSLLPTVPPFVGALLGFGAATWGVRKQLTAQENARRTNIQKEEALRRLDYDLELIGRRRAAIDALVTALVELQRAVEAFATRTGEREAVDSDVATARTACWGALYGTGLSPGCALDTGVRNLLQAYWVAVRDQVAAHGPLAQEVTRELPPFRAQLREVLKLVASELDGLDVAADRSWTTAKSRGLTP